MSQTILQVESLPSCHIVLLTKNSPPLTASRRRDGFGDPSIQHTIHGPCHGLRRSVTLVCSDGTRLRTLHQRGPSSSTCTVISIDGAPSIIKANYWRSRHPSVAGSASASPSSKVCVRPAAQCSSMEDSRHAGPMPPAGANSVLRAISSHSQSRTAGQRLGIKLKRLVLAMISSQTTLQSPALFNDVDGWKSWPGGSRFNANWSQPSAMPPLWRNEEGSQRRSLQRGPETEADIRNNGGVATLTQMSMGRSTQRLPSQRRPTLSLFVRHATRPGKQFGHHSSLNGP